MDVMPQNKTGSSTMEATAGLYVQLTHKYWREQLLSPSAQAVWNHIPHALQSTQKIVAASQSGGSLSSHNPPTVAWSLSLSEANFTTFLLLCDWTTFCLDSHHFSLLITFLLLFSFFVASHFHLCPVGVTFLTFALLFPSSVVLFIPSFFAVYPYASSSILLHRFFFITSSLSFLLRQFFNFLYFSTLFLSRFNVILRSGKNISKVRQY